MAELQAMTALGAHEPAVVTVGPLVVTERIDVALASVAVRKGRAAVLAKAARKIGLPLPEAARHDVGKTYSAFWVAPDMWFVEAPLASHEDQAATLKAGLTDAASVTEQTDAWVAFDLAAPNLAPLLERLCNVDLPGVPDGYATRTVMEHLGCYLIKHGIGEVRIYGPRSSARSLLHAVEVAAASAW